MQTLSTSHGVQACLQVKDCSYSLSRVCQAERANGECELTLCV